MIFWADKCEGPEGRGALRVNELELSLCGLKAVTYAFCLTWNSSGQFHFKGLFLLWGRPEHLVPSSLFVHAFHLVLSSSDNLSLLFLTCLPHLTPSPPQLDLLSTPSMFLLPPPCCSSSSSSEPEEWGWQVHGWEEGRKGREGGNRGQRKLKELRFSILIVIK